MATTPPTNPLCRYINDQENGETKDLLNTIVTEKITNQDGKTEQVNLCEKLKKFEENLRKLSKLSVAPENEHYEEYIEFNKKLNKVIRLIHKKLDDINRDEEFTIGGKSMKRKSMKRKSMKRKYSKRKSMKRKSMKRKSMKRKSMKRRSMKRN